MASLRSGSAHGQGRVCPVTTKTSYKNERSARVMLAARSRQGYNTLTIQACPACHGWHIVAQPKEVQG